MVQLQVKKVAPEASCRCQGHWASTARLGSHHTQVQLPLSLPAPIPAMEQTGSASGSCGCRLWLWSCLAPLGPAQKAGWARQCETKVRFPRSRGCQVTLESQHRPPQVAPGRRQDGLAVLQPVGQSTWEVPIAARVAAERTQVPGNTRHSEILETDSGLESPGTPEGVGSLPCPHDPRLASGGPLPVPGDNLPTGLAPGKPAQLPQQMLPSSSSLLHCLRGEKNSPEPTGTVPKFSFLPTVQEKQQRAARNALSFSLSPSHFQ